MQRITEPELMDDDEQALAYANADFEEPHTQFITSFKAQFSTWRPQSTLDLGCGPGDVTLRFARAFPQTSILGVDGSAAMIRLANARKGISPDFDNRVTFIQEMLPAKHLPTANFDTIISNSLLHHLHDPNVLWQTIIQYACPGTRVFVGDLYRPSSIKQAQHMVEQYAAKEPAILQRDFYHSLLAAFEVKEVQAQLTANRLPMLHIQRTSDRHFFVAGIL